MVSFVDYAHTELQLQPLQAKSVDGELRLNEKFDYERLKLDFKLKEADNRFLQEELENKNKMLTMLTEGLKEVRLKPSFSWCCTVDILLMF